MTAVPLTPARPAKARAHKRVPFWDNARFVCVALVVVGHAIQRLTADSDNALTVYLFIYAFHMPAFAMISGYFSKASPPDSRRMLRILTDIVLPYVIMQTIWTVVQFFVEGGSSLNPTTPHWTLWFLLALALFRVVLPYLVLVRWPLVWAVGFSIGVGYLTNIDNTFSLARAIGILPFFLLGWKVRQWGLIERWRRVDTQKWLVRAAAIVVLAAWLAVVGLNIESWRAMNLQHWFFYDDSYHGIGVDEWWAGLVRLGFIVLAVVLSAAVFALIPRGTTWMTTFGQATMYIYLLHSFVLYPIRQTGVLADEHSSATWLLSMILAGIAISIVLASPWVVKLFRPLIEPKPKWLFIALHDENKPGRSSRADPTGSRREVETRSVQVDALRQHEDQRH
ncbi:MAG: acyltransferase family protein [Rhodoglobus sp.]